LTRAVEKRRFRAAEADDAKENSPEAASPRSDQATFGLITAAGDPRIVQLALKYSV